MKRILLIEDEDEIRTLLETVLRTKGYQVDSARTAMAGRSCIQLHPYDLIVSNWNLGDGSGTDIAAMAVAKGAKAIIVTGSAAAMPDEDRERYKVIGKPFRPSVVVEAVEGQIGRA